VVSTSREIWLPQRDAQFGDRYAEGRTVPQDYVQAHKWFNLAGSGAAASEEALRDRAIGARERVAAEMAPEQIAEAQRLARQWEITW
jgi:uncharacterized protein